MAVIDKREMQYLYREGDCATSSWTTSRYDQLHVSHRRPRRARSNYLKEGDTAILPMYDGEVSASSCPRRSSSSVAETEPGVQGDRVSGAAQAGDARDRPRGAGAAVHRAGREDQGRHPHRGIPDARLSAGSDRHGRHGKPPRISGAGLGLCYELEVRRLSVDELLDAAARRRPTSTRCELVRGVERAQPDVDGLLREFSEHWAVERMPAVDRAVLRLGCLRARLTSPRSRPRS